MSETPVAVTREYGQDGDGGGGEGEEGRGEGEEAQGEEGASRVRALAKNGAKVVSVVCVVCSV